MRLQPCIVLTGMLALAAAAPCKPVAPVTTPTPTPTPTPTATPESAPLTPTHEPVAPADALAPSADVSIPATGGVTSEILTKIAPATASCDGADFPEECANASVAAPAINNSFSKYKITEVGEQAALVSIMLFESGNFKYNKNHFPGVPGQGTRNMQSPVYNEKYAADIGVADPMADNDSSFGSAAWFVSTQCTPEIRTGLAAGTQAGYEAYLTGCVGTTSTPERVAGWTAAIGAMKD